MRVLCTGITGTDRDGYLAEFASLAQARNMNVEVFNVGAETLSGLPNGGEPSLDPSGILDLPRGRLDILRTSAFERIAQSVIAREEVDRVDEVSNVSIVSTSACYRWRGTLFSSIDFAHLHDLRPDLIVTVIDSVWDVKERLEAIGTRVGTEVKDLLTWRDTESFLASVLAELYGTPHYLLPRKDPPETLLHLIAEPAMKKVYVSYPVSSLGDEELQEIADFVKECRQHFVVFDPFAVNDFRTSTPTYEQLTGEERRLLTNHIIDRDNKLLDQSDLVLLYCPLEHLSPGLVREMAYAYSANKEVFGVWRAESKPTPFVSFISSTLFDSGDELWRHLAETEIISNRVS